MNANVEFYMPDVRHGAAWLDEVKPGWRELIDLSTLDVESGQVCVLAQVFAAEAYPIEGYDWAVEDFEMTARERVDRGFTAREIDTYPYDFAALTSAWVHYLTNEKEQDDA